MIGKIMPGTPLIQAFPINHSSMEWRGRIDLISRQQTTSWSGTSQSVVPRLAWTNFLTVSYVSRCPFSSLANRNTRNLERKMLLRKATCTNSTFPLLAWMMDQLLRATLSSLIPSSFYMRAAILFRRSIPRQETRIREHQSRLFF
jgi:hypothetical protein